MISGLAITEFSGHATLHAFFAGMPSIKAVVPVRGSHSSRNPVFVAGFDFGGAVQHTQQRDPHDALSSS